MENISTIQSTYQQDYQDNIPRPDKGGNHFEEGPALYTTDYELIKYIKRGYATNIVLAKSKATQELVVIKIIKKRNYRTQDLSIDIKIRKEIDVLMWKDPKNLFLVGFYGVIRGLSCTGLVFKFIQGSTLEVLIQTHEVSCPAIFF